MDSKVPLTITEPDGDALFVLRANQDARAAIEGDIGCALPGVGGTTPVATALALGIGPDEWWIRLEEAAAPAFVARFEAATSGRHAAIVDVSDAFVTFRLNARSRTPIEAVLAQACPLDLAEAAFPSSRCAGTVLGRVACTLVALPEGVDVLVDRTHAAWCRALLGGLAGSGRLPSDS